MKWDTNAMDSSLKDEIDERFTSNGVLVPV